MSESIAEFVALLPSHKCGLYLEHNPHRDCYETVAQWAEYRQMDDDDWASPEERARAVETGEVWALQWYPETPVGFNLMAAHSLEALLRAVGVKSIPTPAPTPDRGEG